MAINKVRTYTTIKKDGSIETKVNDGSVRERTSPRIPREYMNLGMYFLVPILLGLFAGVWLDKRFDTGSLFTILLLTVGVISAFYNLIALTKKR